MSLKIVFAGTPEFAVPALETLLKSNHTVYAVYTQPDRPAGRGQKLMASPVKQLALQHNIPIFQPQSLRLPAEQQNLRALQPDLMIVVAYGLLLPKEVLTIPRLGCINIHASLLPRWRGAAPIQRAILAGDTTTGITYMQMDVGLDTGDMLQQIACSIESTDSAQNLHDKLSQIGANHLLALLEQLETGQLKPTPQDTNQATYAAKLEKTEALINWNLSAQQLERQVRAFNPWPVAYTHWNGEILRVWAAQQLTTDLSANSPSVIPGTIIAASKQGIDVATASGYLRLLKLQLPGGKALSAADFFNARQKMLVPEQTRFG